MEAVVLVVHLLIAISLIGVVLVQKSEGGGLGIGGGGGGGGMMSARGTANLLTRTTAILAGCFMLTSLVLAVMAGSHSSPRSIIDSMPPAPQQSAPPADAPPAPPAAPSAPVSQ
ncbi:preprotein translocase subunit SecG [Skermanella sp. TT6]|uniref:Protein-export membrane protein SecG n=1 Tax=Skermanella cutis TaxID=2775420 RepID=A0ABX7BC33_9PROT|nr:preprotein translocase subunit SecG [Skermanella sp. TT6]QQP91960.1 preprotein translocase subunit SecG [Skermanella sp. TT6]